MKSWPARKEPPCREPKHFGGKNTHARIAKHDSRAFPHASEGHKRLIVAVVLPHGLPRLSDIRQHSCKFQGSRALGVNVPKETDEHPTHPEQPYFSPSRS